MENSSAGELPILIRLLLNSIAGRCPIQRSHRWIVMNAYLSRALARVTLFPTL